MLDLTNIVFCCIHARLFCLTQETEHMKTFVLSWVYKKKSTTKRSVKRGGVCSGANSKIGSHANRGGKVDYSCGFAKKEKYSWTALLTFIVVQYLLSIPSFLLTAVAFVS
jgi:hypothetical protein